MLFDLFYADWRSGRYSLDELKAWYDLSAQEVDALLCRCLQHSEA